MRRRSGLFIMATAISAAWTGIARARVQTQRQIEKASDSGLSPPSRAHTLHRINRETGQVELGCQAIVNLCRHLQGPAEHAEQPEVEEEEGTRRECYVNTSPVEKEEVNNNTNVYMCPV